ncbi:hypothetical protein FOL46_001456 [Perkinsus olseni]|uniref:Uncharacterized protein n=1 Tax=Perkinsus olseni TaxID=32597 RepID=A0A7J6MD15_PEROL|nr:hypothetical protein FOL46_001456 [Perkinsus olseni]
MGACAPSGMSNSTTLSVDPELFTRLARRIARTCRVSYPSARGVSSIDFATVIEWSDILSNCEMQHLDDLVGATVRATVDILWQSLVITAHTAEEYLHYLTSVDALVTNLLSQGRQPPLADDQPHPPKVVHRLLANRLGTALIERKIVHALKAGTLRSLNVEAATLRIVSYWLSLSPERVTSSHPGWVAVKGLMRDHKIDLSVAELLSGQRVSFRYSIDWWKLLQTAFAKQDSINEVRALATSVLRVAACCGGFLKLIQHINAADVNGMAANSPSKGPSKRSRKEKPTLLKTFARSLTLELGSRLQNHLVLELQNALRSLPRNLKAVVSTRVCDTVDIATRETVCLKILSAVCDAFEQLSRSADALATEEIICCLVMHFLLHSKHKTGSGEESPRRRDTARSETSDNNGESQSGEPTPRSSSGEKNEGHTYAAALTVLTEVYRLSIDSRASWSPLCRDISWLSTYAALRLKDVIEAVRDGSFHADGTITVSRMVEEDTSGTMKASWSRLAKRFCTLVDRLASRGATLVLEADRCQRIVMQVDAENIVSFAKELGVGGTWPLLPPGMHACTPASQLPMKEVTPEAAMDVLRRASHEKKSLLRNSLPSCLYQRGGTSSGSDSPAPMGSTSLERTGDSPIRSRSRVRSAMHSKADRTSHMFDFSSSVVRRSFPTEVAQTEPPREAVRESASFELGTNPRPSDMTLPVLRDDSPARASQPSAILEGTDTAALLAMLREQRDLNKSLLEELRQSREQFAAAITARDQEQVVVEAVDAAQRDRERQLQAMKHEQYLKSLSRIGTTLSPGKARHPSNRSGIAGSLTARPAVETPMLKTLLQREALWRPLDGDSAPTSYVTTSRTDYNVSNLRAMDNLFDDMRRGDA